VPQNKYLRAWLDDQEGMTRNDVSDLVMVVFDSVAGVSFPARHDQGHLNLFTQ
jgi:hypothetical protein